MFQTTFLPCMLLILFLLVVDTLAIPFDQRPVSFEAMRVPQQLSQKMESMKRFEPLVPHSSFGWANVRDPPYNAAGNGFADDTVAIQKALDDVGARGGGVVYMPEGNYMIASFLKIPAGTVLKGVASHVHSGWGDPSRNVVIGTTLLAVYGAGNFSATPFITLTARDCGIEGLQIFYPKQVSAYPPIQYPWTIQCGFNQDQEVNNAFVRNVLLVNPWAGIDVGTFRCPRHWIENVYGQPLKIGIKVDQCYDIGRIEHIHFWPFWSSDPKIFKFMSDNGVTFEIYRTDWEVIHDVFSWGYGVGMLFNSSKYGSCNGQFSNINFDNVDIGLDITDTQNWGIMFTNLNLANAGAGTNKIAILGRKGSAYTVIRGASFWGEFNQNVVWGNGGLLSLSDSIMMSWNKTVPAIQIDSGRATLHSNYFNDKIGTAISVNSGSDRVIITGNDLIGNLVNIAAGPLVMNANNLP